MTEAKIDNVRSSEQGETKPAFTDAFIDNMLNKAKGEVEVLVDEFMERHHPTGLHWRVKGLKVVALRKSIEASPVKGKGKGKKHTFLPPTTIDTPRKDVKMIRGDESEIEQEMNDLSIYNDVNSNIHEMDYPRPGGAVPAFR